MNHTTRLKQNLSTALFAVATASFVSAFAISALLFPASSVRTAEAQSELDLASAQMICAQATPSTPAYGTCKDMTDAIATARAPRDLRSDLNPPYKQLNDCREAVDYIFNDRVDYTRAIRVVYRESTYNPNARRPGSQYAGCAQLSSTLQRLFLKGPWNDPYYNVLALRDAVDNPAWGWCHWDIVNYCKPGGEF